MKIKLTLFLLLLTFLNLKPSEIGSSSLYINKEFTNIETIISVDYSLATQEEFEFFSNKLQEDLELLEISKDEFISKPDILTITTNYKFGKMKADIIESLSKLFHKALLNNIQIKWTTGVCKVHFNFENEEQFTKLENILKTNSKKLGITYHAHPKMKMINLIYKKEKSSPERCKSLINEFLKNNNLSNIEYRLFTSLYA